MKGIHLLRLTAVLLLCTVISVNDLVAQCSGDVTRQERWGVLRTVTEQEMMNIGQKRTVSDRFGNSYYPQELLLPSTPTSRANDICVAGNLFELRFIDVTNNTAEGFDHPTLGSARRNVLCSVFEDLAVLINERSPGNSLVKIIIQESATSSSGSMGSALGIASPYYIDNAFHDHGIVYNEIWKVINTGESTSQNFPGVFFGLSGGQPHGFMKINFSRDLALNINGLPDAGEYDLYSTVLHEALHMLGVASAIDKNGGSVVATVGAGSKLYTKYDTYLKYNNASLLNLLTNSTNSCQYIAYVDSMDLVAGCGEIYYNGINTSVLEVYAPNTWTGGSSLSHFKCYTTTACDTGYYSPATMVPAAPPFPICMTACIEKQWVKRRPSFEEAGVLCDIGYSLNSTYGADSTNPYTYYNDYLLCSPVCLAGSVNDTADAQGDKYTMLSGESITITNVLHNDVGADLSISCLDIIFGDGTITNLTDTSFTYNGKPGYYGYALISYKAVCGTDGIGSHAYIFIDVRAQPLPECIPAQCNLICHGDFEYAIPRHMHLLDLYTFNGDKYNSPDLFEYDGVRTKMIYRGILPADITSYGGAAGCGALVTFPTPIAPGNKYMGISGASSNQECLSFELSRPLDPTKTYDFSFDGNIHTSTCLSELKIYLSENAPCSDASDLDWNNCPGFNPVLIGTIELTSSNWSKYSINGIAPNANYKYLLVAGDGSSQPTLVAYYLYADNFSLKEVDQTHLSLTGSTHALDLCRGDQFSINYQACVDSGLVPNNSSIELDIIAPPGIDVLTPMPIVIPANSLSSVGACTAQLSVNFEVSSSATIGANYSLDANILSGDACISTNVVRDGFATGITIASVEVFQTSINACDSAWYNGAWYYETDTLVTYSVGPTCDSSFITAINIGKSELYYTAPIHGCDSVYWNGNWYFESANFIDQSTSGFCDTTFVTELLVGHQVYINNQYSACDSIEFEGVWYTNSQTINEQLPGPLCDTFKTTVIEIGAAITLSRSLTACKGVEIGGVYYNSSQTVVDVVPDQLGICDTTRTTYLVVTTIDTSIMLNGSTLQASTSGHGFQWYDCANGFTPIQGATNAKLNLTSNGSYAVVVSVNNCSDTSECINVTTVGLQNISIEGIRIYPNPATDALRIDLPNGSSAFNLTLYSLLGQTVLQTQLDKSGPIDVSAVPSGMYLYNINNEKGAHKIGKLLIE